jgi:UDP-N-acetylglucosamine--N-acetylmuramyl-(pentapeptide) pyrophosphoryl-undecaprenol N-acetylglucosamine transferase
MKRSRKIIAFTGGGSGGHVFPAFGVIDELDAAKVADYRLVWIGSRRGVEGDMVRHRGIDFFGISAGKLRRYLSLRNLADAVRFLSGILEALFLMLRLRPAILFSKGGFVSVPPVIAAGLLGIPVVSHESDYDPGLATRINLRFARIHCIPYEESRRFYDEGRVRIEVTGNPVRQDILAGDGDRGRRIAGFDRGRAADLPLLLVQGGSLGARQINDLIADAMPELLERMCVVHQTGDASWDLSDRLAPELASRYFHRPFFADEYAHLLAAADMVVSRAGASALWELGITGKSALFIPLVEGARGDQLRNARFAEERGAAVLLEKPAAAELSAEIEALMADAPRRMRMGESWATIIHNQGARNIATLLQSALPPESEVRR